MPQTPTNPLVADFLRSRRDWSAHHVENATGILNRFCAWLAATHPGTDLPDVEAEMCDEYLTARAQGTTGLIDGRTGRVLDRGVAGATLHKEYQQLCWLYEWMVRKHLVPETEQRVRGGGVRYLPAPVRGPMTDIVAPVVSNPDPRRIRRVTDADYHQLLGFFLAKRGRATRIDLRNAAMCSLMYWSGLRRSEVAGCDLANYDRDTGTLAVKGKGSPPKWRTVVLLAETSELIDDYLRARHDDRAVALFASTMGAAEADTTGRLRPDAISAVLERACARLGIHVSAHQFRRSATISSKRRGIAETEIARQLGWSPGAAKIMMPRYTEDDATALVVEAYRANDPTLRRRRTRTLKAV